MEYIIEEFQEKHLALHTSFYKTLENLSEVLVLDMETTRDLLQKLNKQEGNIFVAVTDEHGIIGTITLLIEQKFIKGGSIAGKIEDVATREGFTGQGIAKKLIKRAIQEAEERGCYKVILDCHEQLNCFYEESGFRKEGVFMRKYIKDKF